MFKNHQNIEKELNLVSIQSLYFVRKRKIYNKDFTG